MYVVTSRDNLQAISLPGMDGVAEFSRNNLAQVTAHDGRVLIETYPGTFSEHEP